MWKPSPMSDYEFDEDTECIVTEPRFKHGELTCTKLYPERAGYTKVANPYLDPTHALREALYVLDKELTRALVDRGRVADRKRWRLRIDVGPDGTYLTATVKTWPAIPGVTVPESA